MTEGDNETRGTNPKGLAWLSWQGNSELKVLCYLLTVGLKGAVGYLPLERDFLTQGRELPPPPVQFSAVLGLVGVLAHRGRASKPYSSFLPASPASTPQEKSLVESVRSLGSTPGCALPSSGIPLLPKLGSTCLLYENRGNKICPVSDQDVMRLR